MPRSLYPWERPGWGRPAKPPSDPLPAPPPEPALPPGTEEFVVDAKTGRVRQAGATQDDTPWLARFRAECERSLYVFAKVILKRDYLTPALHGPVCAFLERRPPMRKLLLLPREHCKTTLVSHALPCHIIIQPREHNRYFPGLAGVDTRVILACETETRAKDHLRVVAAQFEANKLLRAFWPHTVWANARRDSKKWNDRELIVPRNTEYPDPTLRAIGVDGAVTGAHPNGLIKDDLISVEAANSLAVMEAAVQWHVASRALINDDSCLEWCIGTRWALGDLYERCLLRDPTVEAVVRSVVEDGAPIYPEKFSLEKVRRLEREMGVLFPLLYMNQAHDPSLTDFSATDLRWYKWDGEGLVVADDARDHIATLTVPAVPDEPPLRGTPLTPETYDLLRGREEYLRLRAR